MSAFLEREEIFNQIHSDQIRRSQHLLLIESQWVRSNAENSTADLFYQFENNESAKVSFSGIAAEQEIEIEYQTNGCCFGRRYGKTEIFRIRYSCCGCTTLAIQYGVSFNNSRGTKIVMDTLKGENYLLGVERAKKILKSIRNV